MLLGVTTIISTNCFPLSEEKLLAIIGAISSSPSVSSRPCGGEPVLALSFRRAQTFRSKGEGAGPAEGGRVPEARSRMTRPRTSARAARRRILRCSGTGGQWLYSGIEAAGKRFVWGRLDQACILFPMARPPRARALETFGKYLVALRTGSVGSCFSTLAADPPRDRVATWWTLWGFRIKVRREFARLSLIN